MAPENPKWYFKAHWLIIGFLSIGPLMLPLVWFNPRLSKNKKALITVIIIVLSYYLISLLANSLKSVKGYYELLSTGNF